MGSSSLSPITSETLTPIRVWDIPPHNCGGEEDNSPRLGERSRKDGWRDRRTSGRRVLLIGRLRELALYRAEVLRMHGFQVATPQTPAAATELIRRHQFDIAVLSYTLASDVVEELAEQIRQHCPSCPLIAISETRSFDKKVFPDETVFAEEGPAALIAALRRVSRDAN